MEYLALLLPVCLCWRDRHLFAVTTAAALVIAAAGSRGGTASLVYLIPVLAVTFVLGYRLGNAGGWRRTIAGPALLAATAEFVNTGFNPLFLMVTFGPWAAGEFVRSRRRLAAELAEAGELLEAERSRYAEEAVRYERVHLARELDDTMAHWLTAVVIQARAGQVRSLTERESMAATFANIVTAAARADEEITRAATLLGRDGTSADSLLELADHLVGAVRVTGTDVTFRKAGHHVPSPAVAADALRIIQEGLTNSMKHAPGAPISVTLEVTVTGLNVDIINGPASSAPLELEGHGGRCRAARDDRTGQRSWRPAEHRACTRRRLAGSRQPALGHTTWGYSVTAGGGLREPAHNRMFGARAGTHGRRTGRIRIRQASSCP